MEELIFNKKVLALTSTVSEQLMEEVKLDIGRNGIDFIQDQFTMRLQAYILASQEEIKEVEKYAAPQKFWDWVFRKQQRFIFTINCTEIFLNPPRLKPGTSVMWYTME